MCDVGGYPKHLLTQKFWYSTLETGENKFSDTQILIKIGRDTKICAFCIILF